MRVREVYSMDQKKALEIMAEAYAAYEKILPKPIHVPISSATTPRAAMMRNPVCISSLWWI